VLSSPTEQQGLLGEERQRHGGGVEEVRPLRAAGELRVAHRAVALQVEFGRQILKPSFHLIGFRLWV
jgi:hypothetical protein